LIRLAMFRDPALGAGLAMSALVSAVVMATLVVGPFYLAHALGLGTALVGIVMSVGPAVSALAGVPAGRLVDRFGARRTAVGGLIGMGAGCAALCLAPAALGVAGYAAPLALLTAHYALFQAANNTAVMAGAGADQRGVVSGMLGLSRNLGLVTGASAMGAVFALAAPAAGATAASPEAAAIGMRATFAAAAGLIALALAIAWAAGRGRQRGL
jgi:MFS family permease